MFINFQVSEQCNNIDYTQQYNSHVLITWRYYVYLIVSFVFISWKMKLHLFSLSVICLLCAVLRPFSAFFFFCLISKWIYWLDWISYHPYGCRCFMLVFFLTIFILCGISPFFFCRSSTHLLLCASFYKLRILSFSAVGTVSSIYPWLLIKRPSIVFKFISPLI